MIIKVIRVSCTSIISQNTSSQEQSSQNKQYQTKNKESPPEYIIPAFTWKIIAIECAADSSDANKRTKQQKRVKNIECDFNVIINWLGLYIQQ